MELLGEGDTPWKPLKLNVISNKKPYNTRTIPKGPSKLAEKMFRINIIYQEVLNIMQSFRINWKTLFNKIEFKKLINKLFWWPDFFQFRISQRILKKNASKKKNVQVTANRIAIIESCRRYRFFLKCSLQ